MQNKRVFVSGGAGVIGTVLVNLLLKEGADLYVGDLKTCPREWLGKVKYRQGDLNFITPEELLEFDPEIFFHLAATFERSEETFSFYKENFHHNLQLSHYLMDILKQGSSLRKVIFASSYLIYDPSLYLFKNHQAQSVSLNEGSPILPRNTCGGAKFFHEQELLFLNHFMPRVEFISARIFRVYGYGSRDVISRWIRAAIRNEKIQAFRTEGNFDYIFAEDVAEALYRLALTDKSGVVNVASGKARSVQNVLDLLTAHFPALKVEKIEAEIPFEHSQADISRLKEWTGWEPAWQLESAIPKMIDFEQRVGKGSRAKAQTAVLITSLSKKAPLVEAVRNASKKLGAFQEVYGCDSDEACIGQYIVDGFWNCRPARELTAEDVFSYCEEHRISAIIPTRDGELEFFARHAPEWQKKGLFTMVSSLEAVNLCLDKQQFANRMLQARLPAIPAASAASAFSVPFYVVKERKGAGSRKIGLKLSLEEAVQHASLLEEPIFQPFVEGREWSVDLYRTREGKVKGCIARLRNYVQGGESQVTTTASYPEMEHLCREMAEKLDLYGHAVIQLLEDQAGNFHVIECNPRFGGASTASLAAGLDSFFWFFLECMGAHLQDYPFNRIKGEVRQIRYLTDRIIPCPSFLI